MNWLETIRTGLEAVISHRLRSGLTMLGILIGIGAVILTVGLGEGAQAQVSAQIEALGSNLLIVTPGSATSSGVVRGGLGSATTLTTGDAQALANPVDAPDIAAVAPTIKHSETLTAGTATWTTTVIGTTPSFLAVRGRTVVAGHFFTQADMTGQHAVTVLGPTTSEELFGFRNPVGRTVDIGGTPLTVIGELNSVGSSGSTNEDDMAIVPMTTAASQLFGGANPDSVSAIYLKATSASTLSAAYQEAEGELLALHHISVPAAADFTITSQQSLVNAATSVAKTLTALLAGIAGISLLVGGVGVMNIMLVSVTERVREIGLRKALGATPRAIRRQFLVEASVLGLSGGVLGVGLGLLGAAVLPKFTPTHIVISPTAVVGSIVVAIGIGVAFGVYPASRAARLAPIDALRSE